jgi:hypothetical protein
MRIVLLLSWVLSCVLLAGCSGAVFGPDGAAPDTAAAPVSAAPPAAAPSRPTPPAGGGSSASGGARTAASRPPPPDPTEPQNDPLTQARVDCWMKVEQQHFVRDIDKRIAFVDKCMAQATKGKQ